MNTEDRLLENRVTKLDVRKRFKLNNETPIMMLEKERKILFKNLSAKGYFISAPKGKNNGIFEDRWEYEILDSSFLSHYITAKLEEAGVAYYCKNCGCELYGHWIYLSPDNSKNNEIRCYFPETKEVYDECKRVAAQLAISYSEKIDSVRKLSDCPVCGANLLYEKGYYMEITSGGGSLGISETANIWTGRGWSSIYLSSNEDDLESLETFEEMFSEMYRIRSYENAERAKVAAQNYISGLDLPVMSSISDNATDEIKSNVANLKKYLLNLIKLETNIYFLTERLPILYANKAKMGSYGTSDSTLCTFENKDTVEKATLYYNDCLARLQFYTEELTCIAKPEPPVLKKAGLFNKRTVEKENDTLQKCYNRDLKTYEKRIAGIEAKISALQNEVNAAKEVLEQAKAALDTSPANEMELSSGIQLAINTEIKEAEELLRRCYEYRNQLYSYDIIFSKYRNLVSISTFYEYLAAGRCSTLEGACGAYNLYEQETRADIVIGQLSQVIEKLDDIKKTQYLLYSELQSINKSLDNLNSTMNSAMGTLQHIADQTDIIAYNSSITAHYSKVNAELTDALGYMVAFK